ncbi:NADP-dependent oxidoreductase domain-containing protein [Cadophora sp. MPI-SDFR-AT-0126]|nr:NADP-dependent oxidoreductase domain-containing protein [Leotiomycetes sp. MPI-SDFR-AT-0126]
MKTHVMKISNIPELVGDIVLIQLLIYFHGVVDCHLRQTRDALQLGIRHIDVTKADEYIEVARAIKDSGIPRSHVFLTVRASFLEDVSRTIDDALLALGTPYIDLFLTAREPYKHEWQLTIAWSAVEEIKVDERARSIGVANMEMEDLSIIVKQAERFLPVVNQVKFHPFYQQTEFLQWSKHQGVVTATYRPLDSVSRMAMEELASISAENIF